MMYTIEATDDLTIEIWPSGRGDRALVKVISRAMAADPETNGVIVIYPNEIRRFVDALGEAAGILATFASAITKGAITKDAMEGGDSLKGVKSE
jgi:hypothetical protein